VINILVEGVRDAYELLAGVADRARDATPAWDRVADDVFAFQRRWWLTGGGGTWGRTTDREQRPGRNPQYMVETGGLRAAATVRGAPRQVVTASPTFLFVGVTDGLAAIHEARGRDVLGTPPGREVRRWTEQVGRFILTGAHG